MVDSFSNSIYVYAISNLSTDQCVKTSINQKSINFQLTFIKHLVIILLGLRNRNQT